MLVAFVSLEKFEDSMSEALRNPERIVGLIMGSESDWKTMRPAAERLDSLGIECEVQVVSAHRTPDHLFRYADAAERKGLSLIIAGAGGAAHLPGMTASKTIVPVIGVPVSTATPLRGVDAFLSIMQMPAEVGVATVGAGPRGADQAALFAATILAREDVALRTKLRQQREDMLQAARDVSIERIQDQDYKVVILAEEDSDFALLEKAADQLKGLEIPCGTRFFRRSSPAEALLRVTREEEEAGAVAFIVGSNQGIESACKIARTTILPVLGVPIVSGSVESIDRFVQPFFEMPSGIATFAIGRAGAINAALFAATILSAPGSETWKALDRKRKEQIARVLAMKIDRPVLSSRGRGMAETEAGQPFVAVVCGNESDGPTMQHAIKILEDLHVRYEKVVLQPGVLELSTYLEEALGRGLQAVIVGTNFAYTDECVPSPSEALVPIFRVVTGSLSTSDNSLALNSASTGQGADAAKNAALLAAQAMAGDDTLRKRIHEYRQMNFPSSLPS
jgi:5-(carboxyamino)imidazole ribonucleotide mutase